LRQALARTIALKDDATVSRAELVRMGLEDWRRVFRPKPERMITERRWFDLFHRTLDRAGSVWPLDAVEIYLPERPARKVAVTAEASQALELVPVQPTFAELHATISGLANPLQPTAAEKKVPLGCRMSLVSAGAERRANTKGGTRRAVRLPHKTRTRKFSVTQHTAGCLRSRVACLGGHRRA
jgi:hypothetical protein